MEGRASEGVLRMGGGEQEQTIAVHEWRYSHNCSGPVAQTIVFMQREYRSTPAAIPP